MLIAKWYRASHGDSSCHTLEKTLFLEGLRILYAKTSALSAFPLCSWGTVAVVRPGKQQLTEQLTYEPEESQRQSDVKRSSLTVAVSTAMGIFFGASAHHTSRLSLGQRNAQSGEPCITNQGLFEFFVSHRGQGDSVLQGTIRNNCAAFEKRTQGARCLLGHAGLRKPWSNCCHTVLIRYLKQPLAGVPSATRAMAEGASD
jgi:hypothetical protein